MKNPPMYGVNTNEKTEWFINMYISYDVSLLPNSLQNAQQHQHMCTCKKKVHVVSSQSGDPYVLVVFKCFHNTFTRCPRFSVLFV